MGKAERGGKDSKRTRASVQVSIFPMIRESFNIDLYRPRAFKLSFSLGPGKLWTVFVARFLASVEMDRVRASGLVRVARAI